MVLKLNAQRVAIGAALATWSALSMAQAVNPAGGQAITAPAARAELAPSKAKQPSPSQNTSAKKASRKSNANANVSAPTQDLIGAAAPRKIIGTLYAAAPGRVLSLGESMLSTAMDTPFEFDTAQRTWGRLSFGRSRMQVQTNAKLGSNSIGGKTDVETAALVAQFGVPVYTSRSTRIEATFGLGADLMKAKGAGKRDPDLLTYQVSAGANLLHRAPGDVNFRLGGQLFGGSSKLESGKNRDLRQFEKKFRHVGLSVRGEVSRDFAMGRGFVLTPLVGLGATTAWVNPTGGSKTSHTSASTWVSARVAYNHAMQSGRTASFWVEPTYINQFKRSTTSGFRFTDAQVDVTSRVPRDRAGARIGMDLPVGKQGALQASLGQYWMLNKSKQGYGTVQLGYTHRF